jgi:hypothetical protein
MHDIEPHYGWKKYYDSVTDPNSPFFEKEHSLTHFTDHVYGYYIHPQWDSIGSETLYIKVLFADYESGFVIIEFIGEWNDALNNDIMVLYRDVIEDLMYQGLDRFILIGENVLNFHGDGSDYYEEWFDSVEQGWITAIGFREHVTQEWSVHGVDAYVNFGGELDFLNWRTMPPKKLCAQIDKQISFRLNP